MDLYAEFKLDPAHIAAMKQGFTKRDFIEQAQEMEDAMVGKQNHEKVWQSRQSMWAPLNPEYKRRKVREGFAPEAWNRRGTTLDAFATRIQVTGGVSSNRAGREIAVEPTGDGRFTMHVAIRRPAAGGWFDWNERRRPFLHQIRAETAADMTRRLHRWTLGWLRRHGFPDAGRRS